MKIGIESDSCDATFEFGKKIGEIANKSSIYCLSGDIGAGKTVLTKGIAFGLGIEGDISSPTFTIMNVHSGKIPLYHFDVYRIEDIKEMEELDYEDYFYGDGVTVIEWAEKIESIVPKNAVWIYIRNDLEKGDDFRFISYVTP